MIGMFGLIPLIVTMSSFFKDVFCGRIESCLIRETEAPVSIRNNKGLVELFDENLINYCSSSASNALTRN